MIADCLLLGGDLHYVLAHGFGADLHITGIVEVIGLRVALPKINAFRHQLAHGRLEVIIADHAAGDARRPGGNAALIDHQNIFAATPAARFQRRRQMIGGAQAVNAGANNEVLNLRRNHARSAVSVGNCLLYQLLNWSKQLSAFIVE